MTTERERFDAVVIGSGLGGLVCGAYLCAAGQRTLVLEAHYVAGGNSQVFRRKAHGRQYEFDVGVHYIGECGPDGAITTILRGVGLAERIVFRPLDPDGFSTLVFPDVRFRVPVGWDRYRARLLETFPSEREGLGEAVDVLRRVATELRRLGAGESEPSGVAERAPTFFEWGLRPIPELFRHFHLSEKSAAVLLGEQGDYAVRPSKTAVAMQAGLTDHYMRGAFYPEGGGQVLAGRLVEAIRAYGGEVRTRAPVAKVRVENGRALGVTLEKTGQEIDAGIVVSNADLKRTVLELVGAEHWKPETVERVRAYRMALPLFGVYLGLDLDLAAQGVPNTNYFVFDSYDLERLYSEVEAGRIPDQNFGFLSFATLKDPASPHLAPKGYTNLQVMTVVPREYSVWAVGKGPVEGGHYHRDPEYRRRKHELTDRLVDLADRVLPGLKDHVDWKEAATPVTQERFTRSSGGTSYGIEVSLDQMGPFRMGPTTDVEGLYLCGASTPSGHGIGGAMRSGIVAAGAAIGADLWRLVRSGEVLGDRALLPELRPDWDAWRESH
jgi:phytoene dehydrogenase-like protein